MAEPSIRELILVAIQLRVAAIVTPIKVNRALRHDEAAVQVDERPAVRILDRGDSARRHVRLAWECVMRVELQLLLREASRDNRPRVLTDALQALDAAIVADGTWGGLAVKTDFTGASLSQGEAVEPLASVTRTMEVRYRVNRFDPTVMAEV